MSAPVRSYVLDSLLGMTRDDVFAAFKAGDITSQMYHDYLRELLRRNAEESAILALDEEAELEPLEDALKEAAEALGCQAAEVDRLTAIYERMRARYYELEGEVKAARRRRKNRAPGAVFGKGEREWRVFSIEIEMESNACQ